MFRRVGLQEIKQLVSLTSLGAEVYIREENRADLLRGHAQTCDLKLCVVRLK